MTTDRDFLLEVTLDVETARFEQLMERAGRTVETSVSGMDRSTKRAAQQFAQLEGKMDPAARAANRLARDSEKVSRALEKGAVSTDRAAKLQAQLNTQYEQAVTRVRQLDTATTGANTRLNATASPLRAATANTGRFGFAAQNAAFQISDMAVQIGSGTSAMRAMSMQIPQLIGGFGPWAAGIAAVVSVAGALAPVLFDIGEESKRTEGRTRDYGESLEAVNKIVREANNASKTRAQRLRDEGNAALEGARKEVEAAEAKLEALRSGAAVTGLGGFLQDLFDLDDRTVEALNPRDARAREAALERLSDQADTARERFAELKRRLDEAARSLDDGSDAANDNARTLSDLDTQQQSVIGSLREQIELQRLDARERAQLEAVMRAQNLAMAEGNLLLPEQAAKVRELAGELYDLRNNTSEATDAGADFERSLNDQQRTMERYQSEVERTGEQVGEAFTDGILNSMDEGFAGITDLFERSVQALATTALAPATVVEGPRP